ncbi:MAG: hypothetical protein KC518_12865 [Candidatus Cloacimonetes bacterium]|nr:hypothetical protein [Candidatus Cloacimonadota bacterium]
MTPQLVCSIHDGWTQVLSAGPAESGSLAIVAHDVLNNDLDLSLARHGHLRPEAREAVELQLRPLALRQAKGAGPIDVLLSPSLANDDPEHKELEQWARHLGNTMGYTLHLPSVADEARLLLRAHRACFPHEETCYMLQAGGWSSTLVRELGQGAQHTSLPWGCERPGLFERRGELAPEAMPEVADLLRAHLKTLDLCGQPAWLLGLVAARLTFLEEQRLRSTMLDADGLSVLHDWLANFDAEERDTLPLLAGRGHSIIDSLAIVRRLFSARGFHRVRFCPWNTPHGFLLEKLKIS